MERIKLLEDADIEQQGLVWLSKPTAPGAWTAASITRAVIRSQVFNRSVVAVPCTNWAGHECDLLVVEKHLRIIDLEVKISRADLKADLKKDKWWKCKPWARRKQLIERREWPQGIWKHYYAMPAEIWDDKLFAAIPEASGVLLLHSVRVLRRAKPNSQAKAISAEDAIDIARLAGLRMWDALART